MIIPKSPVFRILLLIILVTMGGCNKNSAEPEEGDLEVDAVGEPANNHEDQGIELVTLDLSETGVPALIDVPKGTKMDWIMDPNGLGDTSGKSREINFYNGSFFILTMRNTMPLLDTIEHIREFALNKYTDTVNTVEVIDDQVVIYHSEEGTPAPQDAVYELIAVVSIGDKDFLLNNSEDENCTREQIELMSQCVLSLRPVDESTE